MLRVLRALAGRLSLDLPQVEKFIAAEARREGHTLRRLAELYYRHDLQREFALVAGSLQAAGLAQFLVGTLGWIPRTIVVADFPPEAARPELQRRLAAATTGFDARVLFSEDAGEIEAAILEQGAEIVLGRAFERAVAAALDVPLVQVAFPVTDRLVLDKGLSGGRGAVTLVEEIARAVLARDGLA